VAVLAGRVRYNGGLVSRDGDGRLGRGRGGLGPVETAVWSVSEAQIVRVVESDVEEFVQHIGRSRSTTLPQYGALTVTHPTHLTGQHTQHTGLNSIHSDGDLRPFKYTYITVSRQKRNGQQNLAKYWLRFHILDRQQTRKPSPGSEDPRLIFVPIISKNSKLCDRGTSSTSQTNRQTDDLP